MFFFLILVFCLIKVIGTNNTNHFYLQFTDLKHATQQIKQFILIVLFINVYLLFPIIIQFHTKLVFSKQ